MRATRFFTVGNHFVFVMHAYISARGQMFVGQHFYGDTGIGGDGGGAEGPRVEGNAGVRCGNISGKRLRSIRVSTRSQLAGGTGGTGGAGLDAGRKGGAGMGAHRWTEAPSQWNLQRVIIVFLALLSTIVSLSSQYARCASYSTSNEARDTTIQEKNGLALAKNMKWKKIF
jgi:hypothetical protein